MKNYVIINGVNSLTITGLAISKLPSISKPPLRVMTEEINGRDGDLITELGYGAYDKELVIGLYGNYDINEVIGFFNQEGTIVFSNEDDKYYNFKIINQIDYESLIKFRTATISLHCQPFKYPLTETPEEITTEYVEDEGETLTLNDTKIAPLSIDLKGNTSQTGTPTPTSPIPVNVVSGDNEIEVCGKNLLNIQGIVKGRLDNGVIGYESNTTSLTTDDNTISFTTNANYRGITSDYINIKSSQYIIVSWNNATTTPVIAIAYYDKNKNFISQIAGGYYLTNGTRFANNITNARFIRVYISLNTSGTTTIDKPQLNYTDSDRFPYEPYTSQNYPLYLGVENLIKSVGNLVSNIVYFNNVSSQDTYQFKAGTYTFSYKDNNEATLFMKDTTGKQTHLGTNKTTTFTSNNDFNIYLFRSGITIEELSEVKMTKGNHIQYISDTPIELCNIGNYVDFPFKAINGDKYYDTLTQAQKDLLTYGKWYLHKEVGKVVFNGEEYWAKRTDIQNLTNTSCFRGSYSDEVNNNALQGQTQFSNLFVCLDDTTDTEHIRKTGASNYRFQVFINKSRLSSDDATGFKSFLASNNMTIYYVLATPTNTEITNTTLINQLENLKSANSYEGQTNISQVNNDLPFILKVKGTKEGSGEGIINNIGNIYAKPIIALEGTGNIGIYKNGTQYFEVDMSSDNEITIDTEKMEAYHNGVLKNRKVIGDYNKFTIDEGNNNIEITGELTKATISNYTRWL